jgi:DNA-binding transcriptional regulator YiaG
MLTMPKNYRSEALAAIHETMEALQEVGAIDQQTMREFDEGCLTAVQIFVIGKPEHLNSANVLFQ